jgi:hexosaminidase
MMYSKYITAVLLLTISISFAVRTDEAPVLPVVPHPQEVVYGSGSLPYEGGTVSIRLYGSGHHASAGLGIAELEETFLSVSGIRPDRGLSGDVVVHIGIPSGDRDFRRLCGGYGIEAGARIGKEGYVLHIDSTGVVLAARESSGLYYGMQTLKQLLRGSIGSGALPSVRITDWPEMRYRGVMDDISRGPVPTLEFMKLQVRRIAELKLNMLMYYTEHVVKTERHGEFAPAGGGVSIAQWRELSDYARGYHVTLVGNFQSFGHFRNILSHPRYAPLGERGSLLSPVYPESEQLLRDIYEEMVPAFDSPYFCVNSDETFDLGKGASKDRVDSLGLGVVYAEHILRMHGILKELGVRMMMWGDIVLQHPEVLDMLPKDIIMMAWEYGPQDSYRHLIEPFVEAGFDFTISPGMQNTHRLSPDYTRIMPNLQNFINDGINYGAYGMINTLWDTEGIPLFSRSWYGIAYSADLSWRSSGGDVKKFDKRFLGGVYGDRTGNLTRGIWSLMQLAELAPTSGMSDRILWTRYIPERLESIRLSTDQLHRVLEICDEAAGYFSASEPGYYGDDLRYFEYTIAVYRYVARARLHMLEAARRYYDLSLLQRDVRGVVRRELVEVIGLVSELGRDLERIIDEFVIVWLRENRIYALDRFRERYEEQLRDLRDVERLLMAALSDYDKGHYLPPPREVRLDIGVVAGSYFREWMMVTPLPNVDNLSFSTTDYLEDMGGERNARPSVTEEFDFRGELHRWHRTESPSLDIVNLAELYPQASRNSVMYAYATINSPSDARVRAAVGSKDGIEIMLNGVNVFSYRDERSLSVDDDRITLPLTAGRNHLMLKITRGGGEGWGFSFRLLDGTVHNNKNRYYIQF